MYFGICMQLLTRGHVRSCEQQWLVVSGCGQWLWPVVVASGCGQEIQTTKDMKDARRFFKRPDGPMTRWPDPLCLRGEKAPEKLAFQAKANQVVPAIAQFRIDGKSELRQFGR